MTELSIDRKTELTVQLALGMISKQTVTIEQIPELMKSCWSAITQVTNPEPVVIEVKQEPAVPIRKSVTPDYIICLEDGKKFKSLKRHLRTHYNLSPEEYREKWGLPGDYPFTAPNYSAKRSQLAKANGLGRK